MFTKTIIEKKIMIINEDDNYNRILNEDDNYNRIQLKQRLIKLISIWLCQCWLNEIDDDDNAEAMIMTNYNDDDNGDDYCSLL